MLALMNAHQLAVFEQLGFAPARRSYRMEIDLHEEGSSPVWPEGISERTLQKDEERRVYEVVMEVWQDTRTRWTRRSRSGPTG